MGKKKMPPCVSDISVFDTKTFHVECLENQGKITMFVFIIKKKKKKAWSNSSCFIKPVFFNCDALIVTQILFKS